MDLLSFYEEDQIPEPTAPELQAHSGSPAMSGKDEEVVHSVVNFNNEGKFKTSMPDNVTRGRHSRITSKPSRKRCSNQVQEIETLLESTMLERSRETDRKHIAT